MHDWQALRSRVRGALSLLECEELAYWAARAPAGDALEVGHYAGLSTIVLCWCLPPRAWLVTIDHHHGDVWCDAVPIDEFERNIAWGWRHGLDEQSVMLGIYYQPFAEAIPRLPDQSVTFVFYDADHSPEACAEFWQCVEPKLAPRCLFLFDDADWVGGDVLRDAALAAGFKDVARYPYRRGGKGNGKEDPRTFTLATMSRGVG